MALTAKKVYAILKRQISDMEAKLNSPVRYRGTVATADLLPLNPDIGDMYNIESKSIYGEAGMNVAWNGVVWDTMGAPIDMSLYLTKEEAESVIQRLVTEYFEKNPVKPGATTEQAQQIEQNKTDIASLKTETGSLKEDISTKITKFYASSQGETHIADSDNGKIMDMVLYGRSEQKQYSGKNLLKPTLQTTIKNGVTCTANGDGTYTLNGTATTTTVFDIAQNVSCSSFRLAGCPVGGAHDTSYELQARTDNLIYGYDTGDGKNIKADENFFIKIRINTGINCNNLLFKPMIVDASLYPDATYDDFEPYVGGQPSPSPDYPQEIKSVVNPTVKVCGKNLLEDGSLKSDNNGKIEYISAGKIKVTSSISTWYAAITNTLKLTPNTNYVLSAKCDSSNGNITCNSVSVTGAYIKCAFLTDSDGLATIAIRCRYESAESRFVYSDLQLEKGSTATAYEPYTEQTVTLPYTLNAIPVESGGNVTIDGQQYVSDYVDVERGKLVRMCKEIEKVTSDLLKALSFSSSNESVKYAICNGTLEIKEAYNAANVCYALCSHFKPIGWYSGDSGTIGVNIVNGEMRFYFGKNSLIATLESAKQFFEDNEVYISGVLKVPKEIDLTDEEVQALKALATYYPTTNISVNSEQLDGYTVFNYPISMKNGWDYVKQQIGDTRDYIYDMDARTQDTDTQSAEAYVNSEYAVALTELEV